MIILSFAARSRRLCLVVVMCAGLAGLAACTSNAGAVESSSELPIPTSAPPYTPGAEEAQKAIAAYKAYIAMYNETGLAGGYDIVADGEKARPASVVKTTMNQARKYADGSNQKLKRNKEKQVAGETKIVWIEVLESVPVPDHPGRYRVRLNTCLDQTSVKIKGPKGTRSPDPYLSEQPLMFFDMDDPQGWKVSNFTNQKVKSC